MFCKSKKTGYEFPVYQFEGTLTHALKLGREFPHWIWPVFNKRNEFLNKIIVDSPIGRLTGYQNDFLIIIENGCIPINPEKFNQLYTLIPKLSSNGQSETQTEIETNRESCLHE